MTADSERLIAIHLTEDPRVKHADLIKKERETAIRDLLADNSFAPYGTSGPYELTLSILDRRLMFDIADKDGTGLLVVPLSLLSMRSLIKDYFMICDSYFSCLDVCSASKIETLDMARRGIHNEGADLLEKALNDKITLDKETARRLFTLICILHIRR